MELYPLSKPQQSVWNMEQYHGGAIANITGAVFFRESTELCELQEALNKTVEQNDSLRIRIRNRDGRPMQYISAYSRTEFEVRLFKEKSEFDTWLDSLAKTPFDICGDLYKVFLIQVAGRVGFVLHLHHLTADAWTLGLLTDTVVRNLKGETPDSINSYIDYLTTEQIYENSERLEKDKAYFLSCFERCSEPVFLSDKQAKSAKSDRISHAINKVDSTKIATFCAEHNLSPYTFFLCALTTYFFRIKGEKDIYIGTVVLNRSGRKEKATSGMFVNTIPVLMNIDVTKSILQNIMDNAESISAVFRHQKYQYGDLLKDIRERYGFNGKLYDVFLSYQNTVLPDGLETAQWAFNGSQGEGLNIHINDRYQEGAFNFDYTYQTDLFTMRDIERMHRHLMNLIFDIVENPYKAPQELKMLSDNEYQQVVFDFNDTAVDYPKDKCIHQLFEEQVERTPKKTAMITCDNSITYRELNEQANRIAYNLIRAEVKQNDIVALMLPRKNYLISFIMGVLKSGAAYLPIDQNSPSERINYILHDCNAHICVTQENFESFIHDGNTINPNVEISGENLCYCMYTSGSTGNPKGTLLMHKNLCNYVLTSCSQYGESEYSMPFLTDIGVDLTVTSIFLPLITGGCSYILDGNMYERLSSNFMKQCNILKLTPTLLELLKQMSTDLHGIRKIIVGGEKIDTSIFSNLPRDTILYDEYGPTETTVGSMLKVYPDKLGDENCEIHIGKPIANTQIYILDKHLNPLPISATGELCISGEGVGRGYLNRPELTAEKFVPSPFVESARMYKTGDLARRREDGNIEYIGRMDNQVKIRGLRIELGEIEAAIVKFEGIDRVAVTDRKDENGRQYICAYFISACTINEKALRAELAKTLPRYMIPNFFTRVEAFPSTSSGKTDYKAFPSQEFRQTCSDAEYVAPVTDEEKMLVHVLETVLGVSPIGMDDDFFDLGGDSLTAIEFIAMAQHEGIHIELQNVYEAPTPAELAKYIYEGGCQTAQYNMEDFVELHELLKNTKTEGKSHIVRQSLGTALITGATGWLGAHVLDEFLSAETGNAFCLIRGSDLSESRNRLSKVLKYYFGDKHMGCNRIIPICGDITKCIDIDGQIETIIHCAANVKHYGTYQHSYDVNVTGTENVIALAKAKGAKLLHISTASVSGNSFEQPSDFPATVFDETKLFIGQPLDNVYIRSKFEAECAVLQAKLDGLNAAVIRVGNLSNRRSDYKFQWNHHENATLAKLKALLDLGMYPISLKWFPLEFSPVCDTAKAIVTIARHFDNEHSVFHAYNHKSIRFGDYIRALTAMGVKMHPVSVRRFVNEVQATIKHPEKSHIHKAFVHDIGADGHLRLHSKTRLNNDFTKRFLKNVGFVWNEIDSEYLREYVNYFRNIGYWRIEA